MGTWSVHRGPPAAAVARTLALILVIGLVQCATEQRINSRGSKTANLVEKANGWRTQRGGTYTDVNKSSCLSYGHSCWGAHGKRSGKPPASAPDWYLTRILRMMVANGELDGSKAARGSNDIDAFFRPDAPDDLTENGKRVESDEGSIDILSTKRHPEGIPMLDDNQLSNTKFWQMLRAASDEN